MATRTIVRNRPSLSCSACRRRKIKCEKQRPACANCVRSGDACIYESDVEPRNQETNKKRKVAPPAQKRDTHDTARSVPDESHNSSRRTSRSPSAFDDAGQFSPPPTAAPADSWPPANGSSISGVDALGMDALSVDVYSPWDSLGSAFDFVDLDLGLLTPSLSLGGSGFNFEPFSAYGSGCGTAPPTPPSPPPLPLPLPPTSGNAPFEGHVSTREDGSKLFVEGTYWALVNQDTDAHERILRSSSSVERCGASTLTAAATTTPHMTLPPKHVCDELLRCFFLCVHPLVPLVHAPTFAARYGQLRARLLGEQEDIVPSTLSAAENGFVALLWGVLYAGAAASTGTPLAVPAKVPDTPAFRDQLYTAFISAMIASGFPEAPMLDTLVAAVVVQSGLGREDVYQLRTAHKIGTCIRAAQQLGLHREASRQGLGAVNSDLGRRIWWHLVELDIQSAVVAGAELQAARTEGSSDTRMPTELFDDESLLVGENTAKSSAFLLFAMGRAEIARVMRQIVLRAYDRQRPSQRDVIELNDIIVALQSRIRTISAGLPAMGTPERALVANVGFATQGATPSIEGASTSSVFNFWARTVLHMLYLRASILLQKRFVHEFSGQRQMGLWNALVRLCCQYIQCYLRLWRSSTAPMYRWMLISRLQPLEETLILLTFLQTAKSPSEADLAEHFTEEVLEMCYHSEQAQDHHAFGATSSRWRLWTILNDMKEQAPGRAQADLLSLSWFPTELDPSLIGGFFADGQWQQQQADMIDHCGLDFGLATFLQQEGLIDT